MKASEKIRERIVELEAVHSYGNFRAEIDQLTWALELVEAQEREQNQKQRSMMCGYCGHCFYVYPSTSPNDVDHEAAIASFREHDATCPANPLAQRIAAEQWTAFADKMPDKPRQADTRCIETWDDGETRIYWPAYAKRGPAAGWAREQWPNMFIQDDNSRGTHWRLITPPEAP